jgi:hypothetical protein
MLTLASTAALALALAQLTLQLKLNSTELNNEHKNTRFHMESGIFVLL